VRVLLRLEDLARFTRVLDLQQRHVIRRIPRVSTSAPQLESNEATDKSRETLGQGRVQRGRTILDASFCLLEEGGDLLHTRQQRRVDRFLGELIKLPRNPIHRGHPTELQATSSRPVVILLRSPDVDVGNPVGIRIANPLSVP
jgi:hypothetical protein